MTKHLSDIEIVELLAIEEARDSFYAFRQYINPKLKLGWWQREICRELQQFYEDYIAGLRPKLVIEAPPQHGKSTIIVDFIAWIAGKHPELRTIYASFSERLGVRANLRMQRIIASKTYAKIFPNLKFGQTVNRELIEYHDEEGYFRNTTVRGSITGEGLDLGVVDDPIKGRMEARSETVRDGVWEWLTDDFGTRFADDAAMLFIMTRWHIDDPVGRLKMIDPSVKVVSYPAIAKNDEKYRKAGEALFPEHKSLEFLLSMKKLMSSGSWESLYQQNPIVEEGEFFKPDMINIVDTLPADMVTWRAWDLAATKGDGDYTVGFKMGRWGTGEDAKYVIADVKRGQWGPDEVRTVLKNTADLDTRKVKFRLPQDPGQAGKAQAASLGKLLAGYSVKFEVVSGDKVTRAEPFASQVNIGNVYMLRGPWNNALLDELRAFPNGANDDQVDAGSDAFNELAGVQDVGALWKKLAG